MRTPMVDVRKMRVGMGHQRIVMRMRVRLASVPFVLVSMMLVVTVGMRMIERLVRVFVLMALGQGVAIHPRPCTPLRARTQTTPARGEARPPPSPR